MPALKGGVLDSEGFALIHQNRKPSTAAVNGFFVNWLDDFPKEMFM